jgi:hypothetical protein
LEPWSLLSSSKDRASFSEGVGIHVLYLAYVAVLKLAFNVVPYLAFVVEIITENPCPDGNRGLNVLVARAKNRLASPTLRVK